MDKDEAIKVLREALQFYADPKNNVPGARAREALAATEVIASRPTCVSNTQPIAPLVVQVPDDVAKDAARYRAWRAATANKDDPFVEKAYALFPLAVREGIRNPTEDETDAAFDAAMGISPTPPAPADAPAPDGTWQHAANEWADTAYNGLQHLRNIEDALAAGRAVNVTADRENMERCCKHAKAVADAVPRTAPAPDTSVRDAIRNEVLEEAARECMTRHANGNYQNDTREECANAIRALRSAAPAHKCFARQYSDQMVCKQCDLVWDMNDPFPPTCNLKVRSAAPVDGKESQ